MNINSIDWLVEKYTIVCGLGSKELMIEHIEKAKAIRKKEIMDAFDAGEKNVLDQYSNPMTKVITSEQYYNETYK